MTETGWEAYSRTKTVTWGSLRYFSWRADSMSRSISWVVCPATSTGPNKGIEIVPDAVTRLVAVKSGTSNTVTSSKSSFPTLYSLPGMDVGLLEGKFVVKSPGAVPEGNDGR